MKVTLTPATGLLPASRTVTASGLANAVLIVADCGVVPALAVIVVAAPAVLVRLKLTVGNPVAVAVTVYGPPGSTVGGEGRRLATPEALVTTVIVVVLVANSPEAPDPGAVKVTLTPATGLLPASRTVTASAVGKRGIDRCRLRGGAGVGRHRRRHTGGVGEAEVDRGQSRHAAAVTVYGTTCGAVGGERCGCDTGSVGRYRDRRGAGGRTGPRLLHPAQ